MSSTAYLMLGSNQEEPLNQLSKAIDLINTKAGKIINRSSIYQTAAWGNTHQPDFLNQIVVLKTEMEPEKLMGTLLSIEAEMGRTRTYKYAPRIIDIDILFYDNLTASYPTLILPHPAIGDRRFVLVAMQEIAPDFLHPTYKKNTRELLAVCKDALDVRKM